MSVAVWVRILVSIAVTALLLFGCAGRLDLPFFWAFIAITALLPVAMVTTVDRGLIRERMHTPPGGCDRKLPYLIMPFFGLHLAVAGLDARFGWSQVPFVWQCVGLAVCAAGYAVTVWAMRVNRFYSPVVRIQSERGHRVVDGGPYGFVRHPGYACALLLLLCSGIMLGSWWAILCNVIPIALLLRRVFIEDPFLQANLPGYADYAARVRYRLLPGVW